MPGPFSAGAAGRRRALQLVRALMAWTRWEWPVAIDATARAAAAFERCGDAAAALSARSYHCIALAGANRPEAGAAVDALLADPALAGMPLARTLLARCWEALRGDQRLVAPAYDAHARRRSSPATACRAGTNAARCRRSSGCPGCADRCSATWPAPRRGCPTTRRRCAGCASWSRAGCSCGSATSTAPRPSPPPPTTMRAGWRGRSTSTRMRGRCAPCWRRCAAAPPSRRRSPARWSTTSTSGASPLRAKVYRGLYQMVALRCAAIADDTDAVGRLAARLAASEADGREWLSAQQRACGAAYAAWARGDLDEACGRWRALLDVETPRRPLWPGRRVAAAAGRGAAPPRPAAGRGRRGAAAAVRPPARTAASGARC